MPVATDPSNAASTGALAVVPGQGARHAGIGGDGGGRSQSKAPAVDTHTAALGIIQPPPEVRAIVDKTAQFVARNGASFEQKILANERNNTKFGFLLPDDPYNAYYKAKVEAFSSSKGEKKTTEQDGGKLPPPPPPKDSAAAAAALAKSAASAVVRSTLAAAAEKKAGEGGAAPTKATLSAPELDLFSVRVPAGLTSLDVDTIRLAAASTAACGPSFLKALSRRESTLSDPATFGFLRPNHSLHGFFQSLVESYKRTLDPPPQRLERLREALGGGPDDGDGEGEDKTSGDTSILTRCLRTLEWEEATQAAKREAEAAAEKERVAMQSIDWNDFVVVEHIAFEEGEGEGADEDGEGSVLPLPSTLKEILTANKHRVIGGGGGEEGGGAAEAEEGAATTAAEAGEEEEGKQKAARLAAMSSEERALVAEAATTTVTAAPPVAAAAAGEEEEEEEEQQEDDDEDDVAKPKKIVKNYVSAASRRAAAVAAASSAAARVVVSPLTGELVPVDAMAEHMRVSLLDPRWKTQRDAMLNKVRGSTKATDDELVSNLVGLAARRPDVFGDQRRGGGSGDAVASALREEQAAEGTSAATAAAKAPGPSAMPPAPPPAQAQQQQQFQQYQHYQGYGAARPPFVPGQQQWQQQMQPHLAQQRQDLPPGVDEAPPGVDSMPMRMPLPPPMPMQMVPPQVGGVVRQAVAPPYGEPAAKRSAPPAAAAAAQQQPLPPPPPPAPAPPSAPNFVLEPEEEFAARVGTSTPVDVAIELANDDGTTKTISVSAPSVSSTVSELKKLLVPLSGIATNKQKLSRPSVGVMADELTLAHYNVGGDEAVVLSLSAKQRAARRKNA